MIKDSHNFDALTAAEMTGVVGKKWTSFPDCIGAFIAEMDFGTAPEVKSALSVAVDKGFFGYLPDSLEADLQRAVANWYDRYTPWDVQPEQVHSMPDVLKGLEIVLRFYAPKGGKVIVPTPAYMPFLLLPPMWQREIIQVPLIRTGYGWEYDLVALDQAFRDGGEVLLLCNPHNPVGRVMRRDELEQISEVVDRHDGRVFSDEIHAPLVYEEQQHIPYASVSDTAAGHTVTAFAASKAWNLAGLKCAQIVLSNDADRKLWEDGPAWAAHGASTLGVIASIAAFNEGQAWLDDVMHYLDGNRQRLAELVEEHLPGASYLMPEGTYLAWIDFLGQDVPDDLGTFFREEAKVAITDGRACGEIGKKAVRFNFAMSRAVMEEAITRMGAALRNWQSDPGR